MRILGVDPSSSCTGVAFVVNGVLEETAIWQPEKKDSPAEKLMDYYHWLTEIAEWLKPDMALVELVAVHRNMNTVRVLARYEAASIIALKTQKVLTMQGRVSQARSIALGKGNLSKEEAYAIVCEREPQHAWRTPKKGGMDETDAYVLAKAAMGVAEGA